jgi:hypothetical protein
MNAVIALYRIAIRASLKVKHTLRITYTCILENK